MSQTKQAVFTANIRGRQVEISVECWGDLDSTDKPMVSFVACLDGSTFKHATYDGLRDKLMSVTKRTKAAIAVAFANAQGRNGVVTGINQRTGAYCVAWVKGPKEQVGYMSDVMTPLSPIEQQELACLIKREEAARQATYDFRRVRKLDIRKAAEDALRAAEAEEDK